MTTSFCSVVSSSCYHSSHCKGLCFPVWTCCVPKVDRFPCCGLKCGTHGVRPTHPYLFPLEQLTCTLYKCSVFKLYRNRSCSSLNEAIAYSMALVLYTITTICYFPPASLLTLQFSNHNSQNTLLYQISLQLTGVCLVRVFLTYIHSFFLVFFSFLLACFLVCFVFF